MKTLKITTCQTFTTRVLPGRKSVKTQMKNENKKLTWRESGQLFFFLYCMFFLFTKWSLIVTFYLLSLNPNLGIYGGIVSNFVCQFKMAVYGWLSLLAMEPVAQTGLWIWYGVQSDFKGNPCRMFLLICHGHISCDTTVVHLMWHHVYIFIFRSNWQKRGELCYDQRFKEKPSNFYKGRYDAGFKVQYVRILVQNI